MTGFFFKTKPVFFFLNTMKGIFTLVRSIFIQCQRRFLFPKFIAVMLATACGGPGGVFYPALLLGGFMGAQVMELLSFLDPDNADAYRICIYTGMAGLFSSIIRTPLTSVLVTYELSGLAKQGK